MKVELGVLRHEPKKRRSVLHWMGTYGQDAEAAFSHENARFPSSRFVADGRSRASY
jgi:hypothetical protein